MSAGRSDRKIVTANYLRKAAEDLKHFKERSYQLMQLNADSQVLDVGCGPAIDTIPLLEYIGDEGRLWASTATQTWLRKQILKLKSAK